MSRILSREKERDETSSISSPSFYLSSSLYKIISTKQEFKKRNSSSTTITDDSISNTINELDIADGLKHMLISHGVTVEALLNTSPMMIAKYYSITTK
jgi:adenine deaminase